MDLEPSAGGGGGDRLSGLSDGAVGHILSFLPADEAARAAALSRRWRHVFAAVHTISFKESTRPVSYEGQSSSSDDYSSDGESHSSSSSEDDGDRHVDSSSSSSESDVEKKAPTKTRFPALPFVHTVSAALHGRHRGAHVTGALLRRLHVELASRYTAASAAAAIDGWLCYAMHQAGDELHVDLRLDHPRPLCDRPYILRRRDGSRRPRQSPEEWPLPYAPPRRLFSFAVLRSLRLASCRLDLPVANIYMPSLETLHLTRVSDWTGTVRRLVVGCPRLADLTLEACANLTEIDVLSWGLRRLALRCCHELAAVVAANLSELQSLEYTGATPGPSFHTSHAPRRMSSCTVTFCGQEATEPTELAGLRAFLRPFASTETLQLKSARLGAGIGHGVVSLAMEKPWFPALRHLELTGMLPEDDAATVVVVAMMLERTPSLETLTMFFMPEPEVPDYTCYHEDQLRAAHKLRYNQHVKLAVPDGAGTACLREKTREINLVHYQGGTAQRTLAKFLLCNARFVDEVYCEFARGPLFIQTKLMEEINEWVLNKSANMIFS